MTSYYCYGLLVLEQNEISQFPLVVSSHAGQLTLPAMSEMMTAKFAIA